MVEGYTMISLPDDHLAAGKQVNISRKRVRLKKCIPEQEIVISRPENGSFAGSVINTAYDGREPGRIVCS